jgi:glycosyltransferase involved in cell wall biosynthesis
VCAQLHDPGIVVDPGRERQHDSLAEDDVVGSWQVAVMFPSRLMTPTRRRFATERAAVAASGGAAVVVGGIPEALDDGCAGLLVPPGDPVALEAAILKVIGDPVCAHRLSRAGQEHVRTRFSAQVWIARLATFYLDLARSKGMR